MLLTRDFPDDSQSGLNISAFTAFLQDRGEVQAAKDKALSSVAQPPAPRRKLACHPANVS
jgi:hypothetical protein